MKEILEVKNISKTYQHKNGELLAIKDVNFKVKEGEFISIIGPSGCRKIYNIINNSRIRTKI
jgi:ABC-type oligopeptide transport system ATPase subunit